MAKRLLDFLVRRCIFLFFLPFPIFQLCSAIPSYFAVLLSCPDLPNILYYLSNSDNLELLIIDIRGNIIKTLYSGFHSSGHYSIKWDASLYPSGIYFVVMQTPDIYQVQKVLFVSSTSVYQPLNTTLVEDQCLEKELHPLYQSEQLL